MTKEVILIVKKPGLQTLIQDQGRSGYQAFGVSPGGAMDKEAAHIANELLDNTAGTPVLEIPLIGPEILFEGDCQIALTGADLSAKIDGRSVSRYETLNIKSSSVLAFGRPESGCRAYLAVRGNWQLGKWLGSTSYASFGGNELTPDSLLRKNSRIRIETLPPVSLRKYPASRIPEFPNSIRVRVLPGPEFERFSPYEIGHFFSRSYRLTSDSNRMGYRLDGGKFDPEKKREIISSGIVPGTIQITQSGQPIILMADAQTTGGYYRLANVISPDMNKLAQLRPGDEVWFSLVEENHEI